MEAQMNRPFDRRRNVATDTAVLVGESEAPFDAWTLDELDHFADLDSVRSAWAGTSGQDA
jgi:hypothetical protein